MPDFYKTLNIPPTASEREIKAAYRKLVLKYHPDKNPSVNPEIFHAIQLAYESLSNSSLKAELDNVLATSQKQPLCSFFNRFYGIHANTFDTCETYLVDSMPLWKNKTLKNLIPLHAEAGELRMLFAYSLASFSGQIHRAPHLKNLITIYLAWIASQDDAEALTNKSFLSIFDSNYPFNQSYQNDSPIMVAVAFGAKQIIKTGFDSGLFNLADVRIGLSVAIAYHDHDMALFLITSALCQGIDVTQLNASDYYSEIYDPLFWAIRYGNPIGVKFLLNLNINTQSYSEKTIEEESYLHLAARVGNIDVVKLLVNDVNIYAEDILGHTPLDHAIEHENLAVRDFLRFLMTRKVSNQNKSTSFFKPHDDNSITMDLDIEILQTQLSACMEPFVYCINEAPQLFRLMVDGEKKSTEAIADIIDKVIIDSSVTTRELTTLTNALRQLNAIAFFETPELKKLSTIYKHENVAQLIYDFAIIKLAEKASALSAKRYDMALIKAMITFFTSKLAKYFSHAENLLNFAAQAVLKTEDEIAVLVNNIPGIVEKDIDTIIDDLVEINRLANTDHKTLRLTNPTLYTPLEIAEMVNDVSLKTVKEKYLLKHNKLTHLTIVDPIESQSSSPAF